MVTTYMSLVKAQFPSPPPKGLFTPNFIQVDDAAILASESGLGNKLLTRILLNKIALKYDMAKYNKVLMEKLNTKEEQLLYEV